MKLLAGVWLPISAWAVLAGLEVAGFRAARSLPSFAYYPWDSNTYRHVAVQGYVFGANRPRPNAVPPIPPYPRCVTVFPLYPLCVRGITSLLCTETYVSMLLFSTVLTLFSFIGLYRLLVHYVGTKTARLSFLIIVSNPFMFFMFMGYSDPLFFFCFILFSYFLIVKNNCALAGIMAALSSATRPPAIVIVGGLFAFELLRRYHHEHGFTFKAQSKAGRNLLWPATTAIGLSCYMVFLHWRFGDALAFVKMQRVWYGDSMPQQFDWLAFFTCEWPAFYLTHLAPSWSQALGGELNPVWYVSVQFFVFPLLIVVWRKRLDISLLVLCVLCQGFYYYAAHESKLAMASMGRYLMVMYPVAIAIAYSMERLGTRVTKMIVRLVGSTGYPAIAGPLAGVVIRVLFCLFCGYQMRLLWGFMKLYWQCIWVS